jgi:hypothetical protein
MAGVHVSGIAELRRALRQAQDLENLREFREGLKAAADIVAQEAKTRVPNRTGRAAGSIRATAGGNKAYVQGGKKAVPYYGWLDFGSRSPVHGNPRSVGPWSGSGTGPAKGRFIFPALEAKQDDVRDAVEKGVDAMNKKVGLNG